MLTKQQVLNHCRAYFLDAVNNKGGITGSGWGSCALGTMVTCHVNSITEVRAELERQLGTLPYTYWAEDSMFKQITVFNDHYCSKLAPVKLTIATVNQFLFKLAYENKLIYDIIEETELTATKAAHVLKETDRETS